MLWKAGWGRWWRKGSKPDLMIDLHNDESGGLHVDRPSKGLDEYLKSMDRLETVLRKYTWYTEHCSRATASGPGSIGEGLLDRFGVHACVLELNANWIAGPERLPVGRALGALRRAVVRGVLPLLRDRGGQSR